MTYTVKNGTWCKDNEKEYYSTTKTGLKAALKAGEISAGTRVVIHDPKYHAGQLIQSMNPECPEGCFVPDGSAFDTSIYTELAEVFPDGNLPDMRECVLVMVGRSGRPEITNHDEYTAGQFKNDQAAAGAHTHTVHVNDPGHGHSVSVDITDPGHSHGVDDPGHAHSYDGYQYATGIDDGGDGNAIGHPSKNTSSNTTGISVKSAKTGISASASIGGNTTGISVSLDPAGGTGANVTRTKQFGVYYYIAF